LGLADFRTGLPKLPVSDVAKRRVEVMFEKSGLHKTPFYILFPGAGVKHKQWPVENFASLAQHIYDCSGWTGVICGGPGEETLTKELVTLTSDVPLIDLSGKINLIEFAGVVNQSKFLVGNDTGSIHIAAAVGTPAVCILGGGHYGRFLPYQIEKRTSRRLPTVVTHKMPCFSCDWQCKYKPNRNTPFPCIKNISVEDVWAQVRILIEQISRKQDSKKVNE
jgi:ADP-heptose:LPS heptosyltransferase